MGFLFGKIQTFPGGDKKFLILPLGEFRVVIILVRDGAFGDYFGAPVTDVGSLVEAGALFLYEMSAYLVALMAGGAFLVTDEQFVTDIDSLAGEAVNTEVVGIVERPGIHGAVETDLFGDSRRILADIFGDVFKRASVTESLFDVFPILQCQVFLVSGYKF